MAPTIIRHGAAVLLAAGALAAGAGTASATTLTPAPQQAQIAAGHREFVRDFCDDFNHRGHRNCRGDRWTWDRAHHCWNHDRWDGRRWNRR
jgi:hypothetical protein